MHTNSNLYVQDRSPKMQEFILRIPLDNYDDNAVLDEEENLLVCLKERHRKKLAPSFPRFLLDVLSAAFRYFLLLFFESLHT